MHVRRNCSKFQANPGKKRYLTLFWRHLKFEKVGKIQIFGHFPKFDYFLALSGPYQLYKIFFAVYMHVRREELFQISAKPRQKKYILHSLGGI
jgi:hypothetical protein